MISFVCTSSYFRNGKKVNKSNANVAKYARRVSLRDNNVIISRIKGVYLVTRFNINVEHTTLTFDP